MALAELVDMVGMVELRFLRHPLSLGESRLVPRLASPAILRPESRPMLSLFPHLGHQLRAALHSLDGAVKVRSGPDMRMCGMILSRDITSSGIMHII